MYGSSTKLQDTEFDASLLIGLFIRFIRNMLIIDAMRTPAKYTMPFRLWLNRDDITRKNPRSNGAKAANNCKTFEKVNLIAMIYIMHIYYCT
tara:strand:- start:436 stop:711 length:276 start_codon:yes stop_codon:yes gene_type:complete